MKFKPQKWNPLGWLFIALLVPFGFFIWLHRSYKNINHYSQKTEGGRKIGINPWWSTGIFLFGLLLLIGAVVRAVTADTFKSEAWDELSLVPAASAHDEEYHGEDVVLIQHDSVYYEYDPAPVVAVEAPPVEPDSYSDDELTSEEIQFFLIYFAGLAVLFAWAIINFLHMLQHTEALVRLAKSNDDKAFLVVMAAVGSFVFTPLLVAFVYKSQSLINQVIDGDSSPS